MSKNNDNQITNYTGSKRSYDSALGKSALDTSKKQKTSVTSTLACLEQADILHINYSNSITIPLYQSNSEEKKQEQPETENDIDTVKYNQNEVYEIDFQNSIEEQFKKLGIIEDGFYSSTDPNPVIPAIEDDDIPEVYKLYSQGRVNLIYSIPRITAIIIKKQFIALKESQCTYTDDNKIEIIDDNKTSIIIGDNCQIVVQKKEIPRPLLYACCSHKPLVLKALISLTNQEVSKEKYSEIYENCFQEAILGIEAIFAPLKKDIDSNTALDEYHAHEFIRENLIPFIETIKILRDNGCHFSVNDVKTFGNILSNLHNDHMLVLLQFFNNPIYFDHAKIFFELLHDPLKQLYDDFVGNYEEYKTSREKLFSSTDFDGKEYSKSIIIEQTCNNLLQFLSTACLFTQDGFGFNFLNKGIITQQFIEFVEEIDVEDCNLTIQDYKNAFLKYLNDNCQIQPSFESSSQSVVNDYDYPLTDYFSENDSDSLSYFDDIVSDKENQDPA